MYSSIEKLDIVFTEPDGAKVGVQTDHRDADEIASAWDLSVLFAAARIVNARRAVPDLARLRFAFVGDPPAPMVAWLRQVGVEVEAGTSGVLPALANDADALWAAVNTSATALGEALFRAHDARPDAAGLGQVVAALSSEIYDIEDETALWTGVLQIGAVTFVACRALRPETRIVADNGESLPFIAEGGGARTNVFGKAERYARHGESESPVQLLVLIAAQNEPDGPVVFNLRPSDWPGRGMALTLPILEKADEHADEDLPILALCRDQPNTVKSLPKDLPAAEVEALRAEALASLAKVQVQITKIGGGPGELDVRIVHGDYYAAEKVFDPAFMAALGAELGSPLLTVSMPRKGQLMVTKATAPEHVGALLQITRKAWEGAPPNERLSKQLFGCFDGKIAALVKVTEQPADAPNRPDPDAPKPGFFKRWFGWG